MKISEMITELQRVHDTMGDMDVVTQCKNDDLCELNVYDCEIETLICHRESFGPNELQRDFHLSGSDKILVIE